MCNLSTQIDDDISDPYVLLHFTGDTTKGDYKVQSTKLSLQTYVTLLINISL